MIRKCPSGMLAYESDGSSNGLQFPQGESDRPVCSTQALKFLFVCVCLCLSDVCVCWWTGRLTSLCVQRGLLRVPLSLWAYSLRQGLTEPGPQLSWIRLKPTSSRDQYLSNHQLQVLHIHFFLIFPRGQLISFKVLAKYFFHCLLLWNSHRKD